MKRGKSAEEVIKPKGTFKYRAVSFLKVEIGKNRQSTVNSPSFNRH